MNDLSIIEQFSSVEILKTDYDSIAIPLDFFEKINHERYNAFFTRKGMYQFLYFGLLYSVIEALEHIGIDMINTIPELDKTVNIIVVRVFDSKNMQLRKLYDVLRRCRNATFHVSDSDLDARKQTLNSAVTF